MKKQKNNNEEQIRLQKYMAMAGVASRRKSEELIKQGKVRVNNHIVKEMGKKVSYKDKVTVNGNVIQIETKKVYYLLNKPEGYVTTLNDEFDRKIVTDLIKTDERIFPVGRLDYNTSGLIILTNDGDFAFGLSHPSTQIEKKYLVKVNGRLSSKDIMKMSSGMDLKDFKTQPARVHIVSENENNTYFIIILTEGKNREIRRMVEYLGYNVMKLKRIAIGQLEMGNLKKGQYRKLTKEEIKRFKEIM